MKKAIFYTKTERIIELIIASFLLIILAPVLLVIALAILLTEGRPICYASHRFIKPDKKVLILKFRSMVVDATHPKYDLHGRFMRDGYLDIPTSCEVYTPIGKFLERTQLVEILQLINVIFNGMSFVGNRPLPQTNIDLLKQFPGWEKRFDSPYGMTGISQVVGKFSLEPKERLELELLYSTVYNKGNILKCDCLIILHTIRLILFKQQLDFSKAKNLLLSCIYSNNNMIEENT